MNLHHHHKGYHLQVQEVHPSFYCILICIIPEEKKIQGIKQTVDWNHWEEIWLQFHCNILQMALKEITIKRISQREVGIQILAMLKVKHLIKDKPQKNSRTLQQGLTLLPYTTRHLLHQRPLQNQYHLLFLLKLVQHRLQYHHRLWTQQRLSAHHTYFLCGWGQASLRFNFNSSATSSINASE